MRTETIAYEADGVAMQGHLALPDAGEGRCPGVLVFPAIFGLDDHARRRAERLAGLGYVALGCDLHGGQRLIADLEEAQRVAAPLRQDAQRMRARAAGALAALVARPEVDAARVAAIGFCFGGTMALELGRGGAALAGIVGFHSGLATKAPAEAHSIRGRVLVCIGADDPSVDAAQRAAFEAEMREAGVNWQMSIYGGTRHSFTDRDADRLGKPDFAAYNAQADARSWSEMRTLFDEVFAA